MQTSVTMVSGPAMSIRTMSGLSGVLAGLAVCGLARMTVVERTEAKVPMDAAALPV